MRIILREVAHAHQPEQRSAGLIAVHLAKLGKLQRQITIALETVLKDLHMAGAVHGLAAEDALIDRFGDEHVLAELLPMTRQFPKRAVQHVWRVDLAVTGRVLAPAHVLDQILEQGPALGVPEDGSRRLFLEVEQIHLATQPPVVALLGLLQHRQIGL